jgi:hypothetical protein
MSARKKSSPSKTHSNSTPAPFDDPAGADLIIRSADGVDFYVLRLLIEVTSQFFKDALSQEQSAQNGELPHIDVPESSETWNVLLAHMDPRRKIPDPPSLDHAIDVLRAARKYQLADQTLARLGSLLDPYMESDPITIYFFTADIAINDKEDWARSMARSAASHTLQITFSQVLFRIQEQKLGEISSTNMLRLLQYHHLCGQKAQGLVSDCSWLNDLANFGSSCSSCDKGSGSGPGLRSLGSKAAYGKGLQKVTDVPHWWHTYTSTLGNLLAKQPRLSKLSSHSFPATIPASLPKGTCLAEIISESPQFLRGFLDFNVALEAQVQKTIETVSDLCT